MYFGTMKRFISLPLMLMVAVSALAWGQKGHDTTAAIAERHLTPATRVAVDSLLHGKSIVYWANWLDNASHTKPYAYTKTWHYKNIDEGVRYEEAQANPSGDVVTAVKAQMETLGNPSAAFADKELALKIIVHLLGDMHQPMHMGHATDLGGNRVKVKFFGRDNNLHSIWDGSIFESGHKWSFTEWADQIDRLSPAEAEAVSAGTVDDWAKGTLSIATEVYRKMPADTNVMYNEVAEWTPVIEEQLLKGGLRLAHILNLLFDSEYASTHTSPYTPAM